MTGRYAAPIAAAAPRHDLYLDWLRGIAALSVFVTHVRGGFFVKWSDLDPASHNPINYLLFFVTRFGRESVIIFFVLSGYLVGGHALTALRAGRYCLSEYLAARISRLYAVVVPALAATAALDHLSGAWDPARNGAHSLLVNILFLQEIFGPSYGSNAPFWSLSYEWWFYVLFGFALTVVARAPMRMRVVGALVCVGSASMLALRCPAILLLLPLWLAGVLVRVLPAARKSGWLAISLAGAGLSAALIISNTRWDWQGDYAVGLAVALFVYLLRSLDQPRAAWFSAGSRLAAFSFSLYALHYPLNRFVLGVFVPGRLTHAGIGQWLGWVAIVLSEALACWIFFWLFERHTPALRRALLRVMRRDRAATPVAVQRASLQR